MFTRALFALPVLPGIAAFVGPVIIARFDPWDLGGSFLGLPVLVVGAFVLLWCMRDFYVSGKGTLVPWSPPKHIVVVGLYRYCRNPMYFGVLILILGWALTLGSPLVGLYGFVLGIAIHARVVFFEEPWLLSQFTEGWGTYRVTVPRWLPRIGKKGIQPENGL